MVKTVRTSVELTKNDDGTWLNIEIAGRKASLSLDNSGHGPLVGSVLADWGASHFKPTGLVKKTIAVLSECLLAGLVTLVLIAVLGGAIWLIYNHAGAMAEGFGAALAAGLLGGIVRYFKTTRRLLHKLSGGKLFQ
jgi:hypothetical protein